MLVQLVMLLSRKRGAGVGSHPLLPAIAACSRAEGDAQDAVLVAAHPRGEKSLSPSHSALCTCRTRSAVEGRENTGCAQQGWCLPGDELFLSMGCACWAGRGG